MSSDGGSAPGDLLCIWRLPQAIFESEDNTFRLDTRDQVSVETRVVLAGETTYHGKRFSGLHCSADQPRIVNGASDLMRRCT